MHSPLQWALNELMQRARATSAQRLRWLPVAADDSALDAAAGGVAQRVGRLALLAVSLYRMHRAAAVANCNWTCAPSLREASLATLGSRLPGTNQNYLIWKIMLPTVPSEKTETPKQKNQ